MTPTQTFCRYYKLETENWEEVENLEGELEKRLLQEKNIRAMENASVEEVADAIESNGTDLMVYDSGEFDVLYSRNWTIRKPVIQEVKKRWFKDNEITPGKPGFYGVESVVKATPQDIIDLQTYLSETDLRVREARNVMEATLHFNTSIDTKSIIKNFSESMGALAEENFPSIKGFFGFRERGWGYLATASYSGPIEDVLRFRDFVIGAEKIYGVEIRDTIAKFQ